MRHRSAWSRIFDIVLPWLSCVDLSSSKHEVEIESNSFLFSWSNLRESAIRFSRSKHEKHSFLKRRKEYNFKASKVPFTAVSTPLTSASKSASSVEETVANSSCAK